MEVMHYILLIIIAATVGVGIVHRILPGSISHFLWWISPALLWGWVALVSTENLANIDVSKYSYVPWTYLRAWVYFWWILTILFCIPTVKSWTGFKLARFFRHLSIFWGPSNKPPRCWTLVFGVSLIMLFLQGYPEKTGYPVTNLWLWLAPISIVMIFVSLVLVHLDDIRDWARSIMQSVRLARRRPQVQHGRTERIQTQEVSAPPGTVVPVETGSDRGLGYWAAHLGGDWIGDWLVHKILP